MPTDSLTITDNRTGLAYEVPIKDETIRATDLRKIRVAPTDFGLMPYDPSFMNTASCKSTITFIDGDAGILEYRGYPIAELAENASYLGSAYLLLFGELPTQAQLDEWSASVRAVEAVPACIKTIIQGFPAEAHPMGMFMAAVAALGTLHPESKNIGDAANRQSQIRRLIGQVATVAAYIHRHRSGLPFIDPDPALSFTGNFLRMMFGDTPNPVLERAMDVLFILHADHEQNCSTSTMRLVASSHADPYTSLAAASGALYGPLHGGANEAVLTMLKEIGSFDHIPAFLEKVTKGEAKLMGFGHRVYKNYDPRAKIIKQTADEVFEVTGKNPLIDIARELERIALSEEYFIKRKLYPNVDFYSGIIYQAMGFPTEFFTVLFAIGRTAGWLAQWDELLNDQDQKIGRPRQIYLGHRGRKVLPIAER